MNHELSAILAKLSSTGEVPSGSAFDATCRAIASRGWITTYDPTRPWTDDQAHHIIADAFGLVVCEVPRWQDVGIYLDSVPDDDGHHRVYLRDEETLPGHRWCFFPTLVDAAQWLLASDQGKQAPLPQLDDDEWEISAGGVILDAAIDLMSAVLTGDGILHEPDPLLGPATSPVGERAFLVTALENATSRPDDVRHLPATWIDALSPKAQRVIVGLQAR